MFRVFRLELRQGIDGLSDRLAAKHGQAGVKAAACIRRLDSEIAIRRTYATDLEGKYEAKFVKLWLGSGPNGPARPRGQLPRPTRPPDDLPALELSEGTGLKLIKLQKQARREGLTTEQIKALVDAEVDRDVASQVAGVGH